ncbi:MAG: hypothetical protein HYW34_03820 [Candidatus Brennerbacteria bacterium]|nr:hypothetical protein [Candidatus Brennerbacteria bacterium]
MKNISKSLIFLILFNALISAVLAADTAKVLPVPVISVNPDIYYPLDEVLYLEGRALPNSTVQIQFLKQGAKPLKFNSKSDANGEWVLAEKINLESGDWEVRARSLSLSRIKLPNGQIRGFSRSLSAALPSAASI